jgi:hypothetical protein
VFFQSHPEAIWGSNRDATGVVCSSNESREHDAGVTTKAHKPVFSSKVGGKSYGEMGGMDGTAAVCPSIVGRKQDGGVILMAQELRVLPKWVRSAMGEFILMTHERCLLPKWVESVMRESLQWHRNFVFFQSHTGFAKYETGLMYDRTLCNVFGQSHHFVNVRAQRYRCKMYNEMDFSIVPSAVHVQELIDYYTVRPHFHGKLLHGQLCSCFVLHSNFHGSPCSFMELLLVFVGTCFVGSCLVSWNSF